MLHHTETCCSVPTVKRHPSKKKIFKNYKGTVCITGWGLQLCTLKHHLTLKKAETILHVLTLQ